MIGNLRRTFLLKILLFTLPFLRQGDSSYLAPNCNYASYGYGIPIGANQQLIPQPCYDVTDSTSVDPVSLSLALQANKDCVREEKLQFGPKKVPIDVRPCIIPNHLNDALIDLESGLHGFRNQVVKLKPSCPQENLCQEVIDSCYNGGNICSETLNDIPLTYKDVGYVLEKPKCPEFVPGVHSGGSLCPSGEILYSCSVPPASLANRLALSTATAYPYCAYLPRKTNSNCICA